MDEVVITFGTLNDDDIQSGRDNSDSTECDLGHPAASDESGSHRLQSTWRIWYSEKSEPTKTSTWKRLPCFSTVEGFWSQFSFLKEASAVPDGVSFYILRQGNGCETQREVGPFSRWETSLNKTGTDSVSVDDVWKPIPFLVIGEAFNSPWVAGASLLSTPTVATIQILTNRDDMGKFPELESEMRATIEGQLQRQIGQPEGSKLEKSFTFQYVARDVISDGE